jgi:2',3'-cyclic-nucleotide 2'-phosphodiesterase
MTQVFMENVSESPFDSMDKILENVSADVHIVDLHGEATSEKIAFAYHYKNVLAGVFGTHTHVQTADERIIDGCAFISDVGMTGPYESIIGRDISEVLARIIHKTATKYTIAESEAVFSALYIRFDALNRANLVERIQIRPSL